MTTPTRLAGHGLRHEGKTRDSYGSWTSNDLGPARCSCGLWSPDLPNTAKRKQWHRDHKNDIRSERGLALMAATARLAAESTEAPNALRADDRPPGSCTCPPFTFDPDCVQHPGRAAAESTEEA